MFSSSYTVLAPKLKQHGGSLMVSSYRFPCSSILHHGQASVRSYCKHCWLFQIKANYDEKSGKHMVMSVSHGLCMHKDIQCYDVQRNPN